MSVANLTCRQWLAALTPPLTPAVRRLGSALWGPAAEPWTERLELYRATIERYRVTYGDEPVVIARAPARLSLNPHSDHQGSFVLYACHAREIVVVAGARPDDQLRLTCLDSSCAAEQTAQLTTERALAPAMEWLDWLEAPVVRAAVATRRAAGAGTLNYILGALLRLERRWPGRFGGLNLALGGDIPPAAGQSSSSAIVVAAATAALALADLTPDADELVALLGQAEWYVGTRGGAGDHAAMIYGRLGELSNVRFAPPVTVRERRSASWPEGYGLLLVNSLHRAEKSGAEQRLFNVGVFAFKFAWLELERRLKDPGAGRGLSPEILNGTRCLGDLTADRIPLPILYDLLLSLPEPCPLQVLRERYPAHFEAHCQSFFGTTDPALLPPDLPLRGAALYGLGRADRGRVQDGLLAAGAPAALREFGRLTTITHDGDRRFRLLNGAPTPDETARAALTDTALRRLRELAVAGDPAADLRRQPGFYGASTAELDTIVDLVTPLEGVLGAGLMGAGGGGIVLVVHEARPEVEERVRERLATDYYAPRGLPPAIEPWRPAAGASRLSLD